MKKMFKFFTPLILLILVLVPTRSAQAQGPDPDGGGQVIFGSNYTVKSGDTFEGDLVVFGGNVTIEENASLNGDLVVFGGTVKSDGETSGSIVVVGGQVSLGKSALVNKDVVMIGSQLEKAEGAEVKGNIVNNVAPNISVPNGKIPPTEPAVPTVPAIARPNINVNFNPFKVFFWVIGVPAFAMLLALFWQPQIERTGKVIISQPLVIGAIGLLSAIVATILVFTILPPIIFALAWFFGIVAMGFEVGERFTKAINQTWSPVLTVGFGTFLLMVAGSVISGIPCLGGLLLFLLGLIGVGATVITLFGTRPVQVPGLAVYTPPSNTGHDAPVG
jgi:hypothetical protein